MKNFEFLNTDIYPSVNWLDEIETDNHLTEMEHAEKCSKYLTVLHKIRIWLLEDIKIKGTEKSELEKANIIRIMEFLYCKFYYHHTLFYRKKEHLDLLKAKESYPNVSDHPVEEIKLLFGEVNCKSQIPVDIILNFYHELSKDDDDKNKIPDGGFEEAKSMFEKEGLVIEKPLGLRDEYDRDTVCSMHDNVRYHLYLMKSNQEKLRTQEDATIEYKDFKSLIEKYHPIIKRIYDKMKLELSNCENLWVLEGGGMQHQAFFGNEDGYIGTLYLGMKNGKAISNKNMTFVFNCYEDEEKWLEYKDFKIDEIEIRAFGKVNPFIDDNF